MHAGTLAALELRPDAFIDYLQRQGGFRLVRGIPAVGWAATDTCVSMSADHTAILSRAAHPVPQDWSICLEAVCYVFVGTAALMCLCLHKAAHTHDDVAGDLLHVTAAFESTTVYCVGLLQVRELHTPKDGRGFDRPMYLMEKLAVE